MLDYKPMPSLSIIMTSAHRLNSGKLFSTVSLVDFGLKGGFQCFVRFVGTKEIGVANEEAFFVLVGVDEPAGDAFGTVAVDFAGVVV